MRTSDGFTLVELLVAISIMAVMAALSWQGLDVMVRTQRQVQVRSEAISQLQAGLSQWDSDLQALSPNDGLPTLDWDGKTMRLIRRSVEGTGWRVVAWTWRLGEQGGEWARWQSPLLQTRADLRQAWQNAHLWSQNPLPQDASFQIRVMPLERWEVLYHRGNAWSNAQSSAGSDPQDIRDTPANNLMGSTPNGIRMVLTVPQSHPLGGRITRDWINPLLTPSRS